MVRRFMADKTTKCRNVDTKWWVLRWRFYCPNFLIVALLHVGIKASQYSAGNILALVEGSEKRGSVFVDYRNNSSQLTGEIYCLTFVLVIFIA